MIKIKFLLLIIITFFTFNSFALNFEDITKNIDSLLIQPSNGPRNIKDIKFHASEFMTGEEDYYMSIEDGYNHESLEDCDDKKLSKVFKIDNSENADEWPSYEYEVESIKLTKKGSSIAYILMPTIIFKNIFDVYKSEEDFIQNKITTLTLECRIGTDWSFVYEKTDDYSINLLGDLSK